jgi:hypothetical protein
VTVEDPKKEEPVVFPCNRWLATNADDGMIERELVREGIFENNIIINQSIIFILPVQHNLYIYIYILPSCSS